MKNKKAFTLAEVLIVLALVGFLFTLTIPNLVQKQGSLEYIKKAKQMQKDLQTALTEVSAINGNKNPDDWKTVRTSENKAEAITNELSKKIKVLSFCGASPLGCFAPKGYRTISGRSTNAVFQPLKPNRLTIDKEFPLEDTNQGEQLNVNDLNAFYDDEQKSQQPQYTEAKPKSSVSFISLLDGGAAVIKTNSTYCDGLISSIDKVKRPLCGTIIIDVNGPARPNMLGVDVFGFYISGTSLVPMGFYGDDFSFNSNCLRNNMKNSENGLACTAWALTNKNMDYRKCAAGDVIDWTTSTTCDNTP